jgi:citrate synthase
MDPWRTAIVDARDGEIRYRGYDATALMTGRTFTDTIYLLHQGRLPTPQERALLDAILIGSADHGSGAPSCATARLAASGNRQGLSAAVAAGILAIGDEHGGAGSTCMELIASALARAKAESLSIEAAAQRTVAEARANGKRVPGLGHRVHTHDPRTPVLFAKAREGGIAADGIAFYEALEKAVAAQIKPLPINVDGALAAVLYDMGFAPAFGRFVFIIGRVAGLTAEVAEELGREKAMRIKVPLTYDGVPARALEDDK